MGILDRILNPTTSTEWTPAKGESVQLITAANTLWPELEGIEGIIKVVEKRKPPHKPEPTGRLEVMFVHNGVERTLCGPSDMFEPYKRDSKPESDG